MNKNYIQIIIVLCCSLLATNSASASITSNFEAIKASVTIATDTINPTEKDSTKTSATLSPQKTKLKKVETQYLARLQQMAAVRLNNNLKSPLNTSTVSERSRRQTNNNTNTAVPKVSERSRSITLVPATVRNGKSEENLKAKK